MLQFNPAPYREPDEQSGSEIADMIARNLNQFGQTAQNIRAENRQSENDDLQRRILIAGLGEKYGTVGTRKILRPGAPPRKILGQSRHVNLNQPMQNQAEMPMDAMDLERPDQFAEAERLYGNRATNARKNQFELEDRDLNRRNVESEMAARAAKARALSQNGGKPPMGYRWTPEGSLEAIPGGPAYVKAGEKSGDMGAAYNLYQTARQGLLDGLRGTNTGPIMGRVPAFTSGQQIAQGGVAAMAPVLKQLFRVAGEGVFTDRDQQLLLDMIPTRTANPDAITTQMENIDNIVRAKLRMTGPGAAMPPQEPQQGGGLMWNGRPLKDTPANREWLRQQGAR